MHPDSSPFSEREKDVVDLLLQGKSNKQIALALGISIRTVEFHLSNIYSKLGVASRSEAILKLAGNDLRESTAVLQVKSTVADIGDSTENGSKSTLRRIPMKKLVTITGGLLAAVLFLIIMILNRPGQNLESGPTATSETVQSANHPAPLPPTLPAQEPTDAVPTPQETNQPVRISIPPHTVNGYTAAIETVYADPSHILFQVRLTGGEINFGDEHFYDRIGSPDLYDEYGAMINTSGGWGPAIDPALYQFEFVPVTLFKGDRLKGQFSFDLNNAPEYGQILAQFRFDFDLPINPDVRFNQQQAVTANELEILLDSITVSPTMTQIYLCFPPPSFADWNIGSQTILQMDGQEANPIFSSVLFDSAIGGDRTAGSEPYWNPPIKNGRCIKSGFPIGGSNPTSLTLTIPRLEKLEPDKLVANQFSIDYPGLSEKQAYYKYLEEHGNSYKGPWVFEVELKP